jgi:hypothetical protein
VRDCELRRPFVASAHCPPRRVRSSAMPKELLASTPTLSLRSAARGDGLADAVHQIADRGGRFLITRYNKPVAALVSITDLETVARLDGWSWSDLELLKQTARGDEPQQEGTEDA